MTLLLFRITVFIIGLPFAAWKWGDLKNWQKYYPTILFIMLVNMSASFLTYHHNLWNYTPDVLVKSGTMLEFFNCYIVLPLVALIYLSKFPSNNMPHQLGYIAFWVSIFSGLDL